MSRWLFLGMFFNAAISMHCQIGTPEGMLLCSGDSLLLTASSQSALWNIGLTSDSVYVAEPGFYDYEIDGVSAGGIMIEEVPSPTPLTNPEHVTCHGGNDGLVELFSTAGIPLEEVIWDGKQFGTQITHLNAGIYNYTAIDINGCSSTGDVEITQPELLVVDIVDNGLFVEATVTGGTSPYDYFWNDIEGNSMIPLPADVALLQVIDSQGCSVEITYTSISENAHPNASPLIKDGILYCNSNRTVLIFTRSGQYVGEFQNSDFVSGYWEQSTLLLVYLK